MVSLMRTPTVPILDAEFDLLDHAELGDRLVDLGVVDGREVRPLADTGWTSTIEPDGGGQRFELRTEFATPDELAAKIGELNEGLDDEDPRILQDPDLVVTDETASLTLQAGLVPPSSTGSRRRADRVRPRRPGRPPRNPWRRGVSLRPTGHDAGPDHRYQRRRDAGPFGDLEPAGGRDA
jgi:hypothetical protein